MTAGLLFAPLRRLLAATDALAADESIRTLFVYVPSGIEGDAWFPQDANLTAPLPFVSSPLAPFKKDLLFFKGFNTIGPSNHSGAPKQVFAGGGADGTTLHSLDQFFADRDSQSPFKRVAIGLGSSQSADGNLVSWRQGQGIVTNDNPLLTFKNLFGENPGGTADGSKEGDPVLSGRKRVIDFVREDFKKVKQALGKEEADIYESHVTALDDLAREMQRLTNQRNPGMCDHQFIQSKIDQLNTAQSHWPLWYHKPENTALISRINRELMIQAFSCGLTRVGLLQFGASNTQMPLTFENGPSYPDHHHSLSHEGGQKFREVQRAIVNETAQIIKAFQETPAGDGQSLMDQTMIFMASGLGDKPNYHNGDNIPCVIAGNGKGRLRTGQMLEASGAAYNHVLQTVCYGAGASVNSFGNAEYQGVVDGALL
jgi:hypothetical protein